MERKHNKYDVYISVLIVSLIFGNLGGALMVVRILGALFFIPLTQLLRRSQDYISKYVVFISLFLLYCVFSLGWSANKDEGVVELLYYITHFAVFLEILVFSRFAINPIRTISLSWTVVVSLSLVVALWEIFTSNHLSLSSFEADDVSLNTGGLSFARPFASVTFGNLNGYVTFICFAFPFLLYYLLSSARKLRTIIIPLACVLITIFVILVEASRGGLLSISIMLLVVFLMSKTRTTYKFLIILLGAVLILYFFNIDEGLFMTLMVKSEGGNLYSDESRMAIWKQALKVAHDYWGFGCGIGGLGVEMQRGFNGPPIPHNMFLELYAEFGLFSLLVLIFYIIQLFVRATRCSVKNIRVAIIAGIIALPIYSIIDSGYLLNPITYVALSSMAVFVGIKRINPEEYKRLLEGVR